MSLRSFVGELIAMLSVTKLPSVAEAQQGMRHLASCQRDPTFDIQQIVDLDESSWLTREFQQVWNYELVFEAESLPGNHSWTGPIFSQQSYLRCKHCGAKKKVAETY